MQNFSQVCDKLQPQWHSTHRGQPHELQDTNKAENVEIVHGKLNVMCQKKRGKGKLRDDICTTCCNQWSSIVIVVTRIRSHLVCVCL